MNATSDAGAELYYRPSGRSTWHGALLAFGVALSIALIGGRVYAWLDLHSPLFYANVLLAGAYGFGLYWAVNLGVRVGKVRDARLVRRIAIAVALVSYYFIWAAWTADLIDGSDAPLSAASLLVRPDVIWRAVRFGYEEGVWTISFLKAPTGDAVAINGPFLVACWIGEAVLISFLPAWLASGPTAADAPFCERCRKWCGRPQLLHTYNGGYDAVELKLLLQNKDWSSLAQLYPARYREPGRLELVARSCDRCHDLHTLTLQTVVQRRLDDGRTERHATVVMADLLITAADLEEIKSIQPAELPDEPADDGSAGRVAPDDYVDMGT